MMLLYICPIDQLCCQSSSCCKGSKVQPRPTYSGWLSGKAGEVYTSTMPHILLQIRIYSDKRIHYPRLHSSAGHIGPGNHVYFVWPLARSLLVIMDRGLSDRVVNDTEQPTVALDESLRQPCASHEALIRRLAAWISPGLKLVPLAPMHISHFHYRKRLSSCRMAGR
jgi:hypothetical protein